MCICVALTGIAERTKGVLSVLQGQNWASRVHETIYAELVC